MLQYKFTITKEGEDLGRILGKSLTCDIGKRVYRHFLNGSIHMENNDQLKARLEKEKSNKM